MVQSWMLCVSLLLWQHLVHSQETVVNWIWTDDFQQNETGYDGWHIFNAYWQNDPIMDLGNPIVEGIAFRYHGPFDMDLDLGKYPYNYLRRYFSCQRDSQLLLSFNYGFCSTESSDYLRIFLNGVAFSQRFEMGDGTRLTEIEPGSTFEDNLPSDIDSRCDRDGKWDYESVSDFYLGSMTGRTLFDITFQFRTSTYNEYAVLFNVELKCDGYPTAQPTTEPTPLPTTPPTLAPTLAPSIAPSYRPGAPTNAPTLTDKYVYVRVTGCDFGNCQSIAWDYSYECIQGLGEDMMGPIAYDLCCETRRRSLLASPAPSSSPSDATTMSPIDAPTSTPTRTPTTPPTFAPTTSPTAQTMIPTSSPSTAPTHSTTNPTFAPTQAPTATPTYQPTCETIEYGWPCFLGQIDGYPWGLCHQYNANGEFAMGVGVWDFPYHLNFDDNNIILRGEGSETVWKYTENESIWIKCRWPKCWLKLQDLTIASNRTSAN
eukprot:838416_1